MILLRSASIITLAVVLAYVSTTTTTTSAFSVVRTTQTTKTTSAYYGETSLSQSSVPTVRTSQTVLYESSTTDDTSTTTSSASNASELSLSLSKPLGLILEENGAPGTAEGVYVKDFGESGSAIEYASQLRNAKLSKVQGQDVTQETFDNVMEQIINAPGTVDLVFTVARSSTSEETDNAETLTSYEIGTPVTIQVGDEMTIQAKVGDNLRQVLLENKFELYQGIKQKLGNCGGGGQCTFCAVDFLESDGWYERSEYEDQKLAKFPNARLACLNNIQGPAKIQKTQR